MDQGSGSDVELAIRAAQAAGDVVRAGYGGPHERITKGDDDFATDVDIAAERAIRAVLDQARPADQVVGEELGGGDPAAERADTASHKELRDIVARCR